MAGNGISAMLAHQMRSGDDNIFVHGIVESYTFAVFAKVIKYVAGRVDVICGSLKFTNVEVMVLGVDGWGIKPVPAVGDRVLLVSSQAPIIDLAKFEATETMPSYDESGLKAIPITDEAKATQLITVTKDGIEVTGDNKLKVNADGVELEDVNGNKVVTSSDGISLTDLSENSVVMDTSGVVITDKVNSNDITCGSDGVKINGKLHIKN